MLNDNQERAVSFGKGPAMVIAGPGSGKTTVIIHRIKRLIETGAAEPKDILVISFNKAAALELTARAESILGKGGKVKISTFHSLFFGILKAHSGLKIENVVNEAEKAEAIKKIIVESGMDYYINEDFLENVISEVSYVKNNLIDVSYYNSMNMSNEDFISTLNNYEDYKIRQNKIDFDDMLEKCCRLLESSHETLRIWQDKYKFIMVDEFQDVNTAQYKAVKLLAKKHGNLFVVGDDDQSIYRFRGARTEIMFDFAQSYPECERITLGINYRSTEEIIAFNARIIAGNERRFEKNVKGCGREGKKPAIMISQDASAEAVNIGKKILASGRDLNDICVLYRTNTQSRAFIDSFTNLRIPYSVKDEGPLVYEHFIAKDIRAYLKLKDGNEDNQSLIRIINKPARYVSREHIKNSLSMKIGLIEYLYEKSGMENWQLEKFEYLTYQIIAMKGKTAYDCIKYIRKTIGYDKYLDDYCEYRKIDPYGLYEILEEIQEASKAFEDAGSFVSHMEQAVLKHKEDKEKGRNPKQKEKDFGVTLSTMHSVKGLEFSAVFIASCVEGLIPYKRSKSKSEIEEERRLFYVAATRAKDELYFSVIKSRYEEEVSVTPFLNFAVVKK